MKTRDTNGPPGGAKYPASWYPVLEEHVFETLEHARVFRGRVLRDAEDADEGGVQGADGK
jgi:hypothetical protein